eukprot:5641536-Prymnesium_polylepis.1
MGQRAAERRCCEGSFFGKVYFFEHFHFLGSQPSVHNTPRRPPMLEATFDAAYAGLPLPVR